MTATTKNDRLVELVVLQHRVVLVGATFQVKEHIKGMGFRWQLLPTHLNGGNPKAGWWVREGVVPHATVESIVTALNNTGAVTAKAHDCGETTTEVTAAQRRAALRHKSAPVSEETAPTVENPQFMRLDQRILGDALRSEVGQLAVTEAVAKVVDDIAGDALRSVADAALEKASESIAKMLRERSVPAVAVNLNGKVVETGLQHRQFKRLLEVLTCGLNAYLCGPAGSGKTTSCEQAAKALGLSFEFTGAIANEYKLMGFVDAQGRIVHTAFRRAYEKGGVFLFDEIDGSLPAALLAFNAALSNGYADFPEGRVKKHPDFVAVACANTFGLGANRVYVGRNQLDGASLDRFVFIEWGYDEELEKLMCGPDQVAQDWVEHVRKVRAICDQRGIRHVVSPRASLYGSRMLVAGMDREFVEASVLYKGLAADQVSQIKAALN